MRVALVGYGKMGKEIEKILLQRQHTVATIIDNSNQIKDLNPNDIDIAIEFSTPDSGFDNVIQLLSKGIKVITGTTGWTDQLPQAEDQARKSGAALIFASNFSLGVNLFFSLNEHLAKLMAPYPSYQASITEVHHTSKKDAPSGTAITLAEGLMKYIPYAQWTKGESSSKEHLSIHSQRIDPAPGTHHVSYNSEIDQIQISHIAHTRQGFALGAVIAAEWLQDKHGVYTMKDVLGL